ncbi:PepSY domain-containing protein [Ferrovibrio sp.]|uniref:PepSY domain-containing protein n=1 Tax=Ferrovibrio sp. TaxID=1917215 RepID=UPI0025BD9DD2|nr:PepSY domain-containing protein [Ferrovibrio sp.]MBX3455389.1 PepSY domain-containing protein [Ferrovibrio sp.]
MRNPISPIHLAILAAGLLAPLAAAGNSQAGERDCRISGAAIQPLALSSLAAKLEQQGYRDIGKLEVERGCFEARAFNQAGDAYKLKGDAQTGAIQSVRKW